MRKGHEIGDYIRIWTVKFSEKFSDHCYSSKTITARSVDEALKKARYLEAKESRRISLKVRSVECGEGLDG